MMKRERLGDTVYGQLLEAITDGRWREGDRLPTEKDLAAQFDVSRPVIREALTRLQADGIILARQGSGSYVQQRPPARLADFARPADLSGILRCFEVRLAVEGTAARYAALRRSERQLELIRKAVTRMEVETAAGAMSREADFAFHRAIAAATQNEYFTQTLDGLEDAIGRLMHIGLNVGGSTPAERLNRLLEEHRRIAEAIASGDGEGAEIAMRAHLDSSRKRLTNRREEG